MASSPAKPPTRWPANVASKPACRATRSRSCTPSSTCPDTVRPNRAIHPFTHAGSATFTVTVTVWLAAAPCGSRAVTVTTPAPAATPVTVNRVSATPAVTTSGLADTAA